MSKTIMNLKYKNSKVSFKDISIEFDKDGIATIDDKYADIIVSLPGYSMVSKGKSVESEKSNEKTKSENFEDMTVKQLLRYANSNKIDLKGTTKKEEIIKILLDAE